MMISARHVAAAALWMLGASADFCAQGSTEIQGNYYCQAVTGIQYTNFGSSGSYNAVTNMDSDTGACSSSPVAYSGSLAPLDGEVSFHFRGPLSLQQFAFYTPSSGSSKSKRGSNPHKRHAHKHGKGHAHLHHDENEEKRGLGAEVTAVIDGKTVSWANEYSGGAATAAPAVANAGSFVANAASIVSSAAAAIVTGSSSPISYSSGASAASYDGDWTQAAYYDSASQTSNGLVFLNNLGGSGSGVFDYTFGNSLSYASSSGTGAASSSQILAATTIPSGSELIIMSDTACGANGEAPCGYYRPGTVAYQGFGGVNKVVLAELTMPLDGNTGFNGDMPAYWLLNAQIPRTLQYGNADCSCWQSGCGEFDILEVLDSGDTRCKSTLHGNVSGGDSDYINRPTTSSMKVALVMSDSTTTIQVLSSDFDFSSSLTASQVADIVKSSSTAVGAEDLVSGLGLSLFALGS